MYHPFGLTQRGCQAGPCTTCWRMVSIIHVHNRCTVEFCRSGVGFSVQTLIWVGNQCNAIPFGPGEYQKLSGYGSTHRFLLGWQPVRFSLGWTGSSVAQPSVLNMTEQFKWITVRTIIKISVITFQTDQITNAMHTLSYDTATTKLVLVHSSDQYNDLLWDFEVIHCLTAILARPDTGNRCIGWKCSPCCNVVSVDWTVLALSDWHDKYGTERTTPHYRSNRWIKTESTTRTHV